MTPTKKEKKALKTFALKDKVHFVIYRELDKLQIPLPYEKATRICEELFANVQFRSNPTPHAKK